MVPLVDSAEAEYSRVSPLVSHRFPWDSTSKTAQDFHSNRSIPLLLCELFAAAFLP